MHDSTPSFRLSERAAISVMAQSGHLDASSRMSAFGAKRTGGGSGWRIARSQLTQSGHRPDGNSVVQRSRQGASRSRLRGRNPSRICRSQLMPPRAEKQVFSPRIPLALASAWMSQTQQVGIGVETIRRVGDGGEIIELFPHRLQILKPACASTGYTSQ
jgi:hypothetical protein